MKEDESYQKELDLLEENEYHRREVEVPLYHTVKEAPVEYV